MPSHHRVPNAAVKRHMLTRVRDEVDAKLVKRFFRHKNVKRDRKRRVEFQAKKRVGDSTLEPPCRPVIEFSHRIFQRNLLISPGPEGRRIRFGDLGSVDDTVERVDDSEPESILIDLIDFDIEVVENPPNPICLASQAEGTSSPSASMSCLASPTEDTSAPPLNWNGPGISCLASPTERTSSPPSNLNLPGISCLDSPAEDTNDDQIDIGFLMQFDRTVIRDKIRNLKIKGESKRASQLTRDSWIVEDVKRGGVGPASQLEVREAIERVTEFLLLEEDEEMEVEALVAGSPNPTLPPMGPPELPILSTAGEVESSDDEYFDALEELPYDPIADGFFE